MAKRLQTVGIVLALIGIGFLVAGGVAFAKVQDGYGSLQDFSAAQNVTLNYNDDGQLIDRGTTEGAAAIMDLLTEDWGYSVVESDLNPDDPVVNTASEYMFQMATIGYHILHGTQNVTLAEDVEYNGEVFAAGDYEVAVSEVGSPERLAAGYGGYWTDFDRQHPLEGPARSQACRSNRGGHRIPRPGDRIRNDLDRPVEGLVRGHRNDLAADGQKRSTRYLRTLVERLKSEAPSGASLA
jgi:hypothetical protein